MAGGIDKVEEPDGGWGILAKGLGGLRDPFVGRRVFSCINLSWLGMARQADMSFQRANT